MLDLEMALSYLDHLIAIGPLTAFGTGGENDSGSPKGAGRNQDFLRHAAWRCTLRSNSWDNPSSPSNQRQMAVPM